MTNFGETDSLSEQDEALAEKYLIHVLADIRSTTTAVTFNQLKWENYSSARVRIDSLPAIKTNPNGRNTAVLELELTLFHPQAVASEFTSTEGWSLCQRMPSESYL